MMSMERPWRWICITSVADLGRPVVLVDADDASNVQTALTAAKKLLQEDRVDVLMGTFNGDVALAVSTSPSEKTNSSW